MFKAADMAITTLVLASGHNVMGRVSSRTEEGVYLLKTIVFNMQVIGQGQISLDVGTINPLFTINDPDVPLLFKQQFIMFEFEPAIPLIEKYTETVSNIKLPSTRETAAVKKQAIPGFEIVK